METVNDDFMDSFTPPLLSDSLQMAMEVENEKSNPPCFSCIFDNQNGGRSFSAESYLASGSLKRYVGMAFCWDFFFFFLEFQIYLFKMFFPLLFCTSKCWQHFQMNLFLSLYDPEISFVICQSREVNSDDILLWSQFIIQLLALWTDMKI